MRTSVLVSASLGWLLVATPASATLIYFHKPDTPAETVTSDHGRCAELAAGVRAPRHQIYTPDIYSAAAVAFFSGLFGSRERRLLAENVMRTCMADRGYRRVEASRDLEKELRDLPKDDRLQRLLTLSGTAEPDGKVLTP